MNTFAVIRRALWSIILASCLIVIGVYLAISQVLLTPSGINDIAKKSAVAQTVRDQVLLPKILAAARDSSYAAVLDDATVTSAFNKVVTSDKLEQKLTPATDALHSWLDSKQPDITFTIDTSDLSAALSDELVTAVSAKVASLPRCTYQNTLADAENAVCRSPYVTQAQLTDEIATAVKKDTSLQTTSLTADTFTLPSSAVRAGRDIPEYFNILYAATIVAAGVGGLILLWLLAKHRLAGIVTIGTAGVVASIGLYAGIPVAIEYATLRLPSDELATRVVNTVRDALVVVLRQEALWLMGIGLVLVVLSSVSLYMLRHRQQTTHSVHMSSREHRKI